MAAAEAVEAHNHDDVASVAAVSDGNHFTVSADFVEDGIPYFRGQDVVGNFFIEQADPYFITPEAFNRPYMTRSHLRSARVLLLSGKSFSSVSSSSSGSTPLSRFLSFPRSSRVCSTALRSSVLSSSRTGVDPLSWIPDPFRRRMPRCPKHELPIHRPSGNR